MGYAVAADQSKTPSYVVSASNATTTAAGDQYVKAGADYTAAGEGDLAKAAYQAALAAYQSVTEKTHDVENAIAGINHILSS